MFKETVMSWFYSNYEWLNIAGYATLIVGLLALSPAIH